MSQPEEEVALTAQEGESELLPAPVSDVVLAQVAEKIRNLQRGATLDLALGIGRIIIKDIYGGDLTVWQSHGAKEASFRRLAENHDLGMSFSTLQRSVAIWELCQRLGVSTWKHLGVSHLRTVLGLPEKHQRKLLAHAEDDQWTVEKLAAEAGKVKKSRGSGRPPLPSFVKAIGRLGKIADDRERLFGDLDRLDALSPEEAEALYQRIIGVKLACEDLQLRLQTRVPGFAPV